MELCDRTEAEQNVNVASIVDRTTTSVNLLYTNNIILIISASSSIVLIWTAASYTIILSNSFDIFYCISLFNDIPIYYYNWNYLKSKNMSMKRNASGRWIILCLLLCRTVLCDRAFYNHRRRKSSLIGSMRFWRYAYNIILARAKTHILFELWQSIR